MCSFCVVSLAHLSVEFYYADWRELFDVDFKMAGGRRKCSDRRVLVDICRCVIQVSVLV